MGITKYIQSLFLAGLCISALPLLAILLLGWALLQSDRALRMCIALDQCGNAALGGSEDETISSRSGRAKQEGKWWGKYAVAFIDTFFGKGHCEANIGV